MKRDEGGYIVVETITSFLLFVFLMASILCLINIVTVQARVHYALTQTAQTISMYDYVLEVTGLAGPLSNIAGDADQTLDAVGDYKEDINTVVQSITDLNIDGAKKSTSTVVDKTKSFLDSATTDPKAMLQQFMRLGVDAAANAIVYEFVIENLMDHFLTNNNVAGTITGDEYLKRFGVIDGLDGLSYTNLDDILKINWETMQFENTETKSSRFLDGNGDVYIIVQYKIDYTFGALPLPFTELTITQEVKTKAWLTGVDEEPKNATEEPANEPE